MPGGHGKATIEVFRRGERRIVGPPVGWRKVMHLRVKRPGQGKINGKRGPHALLTVNECVSRNEAFIFLSKGSILSQDYRRALYLSPSLQFRTQGKHRKSCTEFATTRTWRVRKVNTRKSLDIMLAI